MHKYLEEYYKKVKEFHYIDEVNEDTSIKKSGIYLLFIETQDIPSNNIIPIYIGQSKNLQQRFNSHLDKLMALNRFAYKEYFNYFFKYKGTSFYDGYFLYCKIFHFMLTNNCTLDNFKMKVIEFCDIDTLTERELYYINHFQSQFIGFNQFNGRTLILNQQEKQFPNEISKEIEQLPFYLKNNIGYTRFNYYNVYCGTNLHPKLSDIDKVYGVEAKKLLDQIMNLNNKYFDLSMKLSFTKSRLDYLIEDVRKRLRPFLPKKRILVVRQKQVVEQFLRHQRIDDFKIPPIQELVQQFNEDIMEYSTLQQHKLIFQEKIQKLNQKLAKLNEKRYYDIFPQDTFLAFSLKSRHYHYSFVPSGTPNTIDILFFLNSGARGFYQPEPHIIAIKVLFTDSNNQVSEQIFFIDNPLTRKAQKGILYEEQYIVDPFDMFYYSKKQPFKPFSRDDLFFSIVTERLTGFSDFSFRNKNLIELSDVFNKIEQLIDNETMITLQTPKGMSFASLAEVIEDNERWEKDDFEDEDEDEDNKKTITLFEKISEVILKRRNTKQKQIIYNKPKQPRKAKNRKKVLTTPTISKEEKEQLAIEKRRKRYVEKLAKLTSTIIVLNYINSKTPVSYRCLNCNYEWSNRSDKIFRKSVCRRCKK